MTEAKRVLVAGATGNQGGALSRELLARGHHVRALTRSPGGERAATLREAGAEIVPGDLEQPDSLAAAVAGVDAVFVVATPFEAGPDAETRHATNLIDAAVMARVPHVVYSSVASADRGTGVPHFESKHAAERHLRASGARFTIIAPAMFMDMLLAPWSLPGLRDGWIGSPVPTDVPGQRVAVADIGSFAALVIEQPDRFAGERIEIAGDASTGDELAATLSRHAGREIRHVETPMEQAGGEDLERMFRFLIDVGYQVDIAAVHRAFPEVDWHDLDTWAAGQDWTALLAPQGAWA